jgi:hypothetical protein
LDAPISKTAELLALPEIALVFVRLDYIARLIVNANHGIMRVAVEFGVIDYIADRKGPRLFSPR